jgi:hypothetical protein
MPLKNYADLPGRKGEPAMAPQPFQRLNKLAATSLIIANQDYVP